MVKWVLNRPPYQVQLEALKRSRKHDKFGLFLEMGMGKSAIALNSWVDQFKSIETAVVLCPASFKTEWGALPSEWGLDVETSVWPQPMTKGTLSVCNFESARASAYEPIKWLLDRNDCLLIVDESSAIKNFRSKTSKAVLDLCKRAKAVRLLNGTPMSQNVMDLFPALKCLGQLNGINPYAFRNRFAVCGGFMGKQVVGYKNEEELHKLLNACSYRAMKKDWLDLPEKIYTPVQLEMTNRQRRHYKEMLEDFITLVGNQEISAPTVIARLEKLRQVSSGLLINEDETVLLEEPKNNPKIKASMDIIEGGAGKVILVYYYRKMGEVLFDYMTKQGLQPAYLRGEMKPQEIVEQKNKFNQDSGCRVLVAQITTSSRGHTLIGGKGNDRCSRMIMFDHTFNMLDRQQMEDRIHRGEQDRACQYFDLILSPIDAVQLKALKTKQDLVSVVVDAVRALGVRG